MVLGRCGWFWVVPRFSKYEQRIQKATKENLKPIGVNYEVRCNNTYYVYTLF